ncbi:MAG: pilus assembly protein TadG-related protein [Caulobacterales bacterium]
MSRFILAVIAGVGGRFWRAQYGNVAMIWAIMAAALVSLVGLTVDFTRAQTVRAQMQNAVDGAALVAERSSGLSEETQTARARAYFDEAFGQQPISGELDFQVTELEDGGHRVSASAEFDHGMSLVTRFFGSSGVWNIGVVAEAQASASPPIEVALVLDNTGSMSNDMQGLRDAAEDLVDYLMGIDGDSVSVALVPFVAQVNVGSNYRTSGWIDTTGVAPLNGELLEDRAIATRPYQGSGSNRNCNFAPATLGTSPYSISYVQSGSGSSTVCTLYNPPTINYLTLFDQLATINSSFGWKGCVEARPHYTVSGVTHDYDIDDTPPNASNPATLFVPYFWMDQAGDRNTSSSSNSYITDSDGLPGSATYISGNASRQFSVWKYRGGRTTTIATTNPDARGPNRGCPTPIVPLTTDKDTVITAVRAMRHWNGGGTNQAEGLAWGWRVLSPTAPFTEGRPYNDPDDPVRKVIVMMTDGENTNVNTGNTETVMGSDYSAFSHLAQWTPASATPTGYRASLPANYNRIRSNGSAIGNSSNMVEYVNWREERVCQKIKDAGIVIYTIQFRDTDSGNRDRLRNCATSAAHFYTASNATQLQAAFTAIGSGIGQLRLTH